VNVLAVKFHCGVKQLETRFEMNSFFHIFDDAALNNEEYSERKSD
jgi:hypothetical protein